MYCVTIQGKLSARCYNIDKYVENVGFIYGNIRFGSIVDVYVLAVLYIAAKLYIHLASDGHLCNMFCQFQP